MSDRTLDYLRDLHQAHVVAVMHAAVHEDRALEDPKMRDTEERAKLIKRRSQAHSAFYRAVDELETGQ